MDRFIQLVEAIDMWIIPVALFIVMGVVKVKRMQIKHIERMAKIEHGIDPGDEVQAYKKDAV
jgi:hypothetical protein